MEIVGLEDGNDDNMKCNITAFLQATVKRTLKAITDWDLHLWDIFLSLHVHSAWKCRH
jgi:hypothetical protein